MEKEYASDRPDHRFFFGLFVILNGIWTGLSLSPGDEPLGYMIIFARLIIPGPVQYAAWIDEKREA